MSNKEPLRNKSYAFALQAVKICKNIAAEHREYILTKQLIRSATSVGANIEEAQQPQSRRDFVAKLSISLKEAFESRFWIRLLRDTNLLSPSISEKLLKDLEEVIALLSSSIGTVKQNIRN